VTRRPPLWRTPIDQEVDAELAFHLEMTIRELMEQGMTRPRAQAEAERRFGDVHSVNAECRRYGNERDRRARRAEYWGELRQDVVFTIRQLTKARGFATVAILTLALGIGATAAVFSVLDAVVLRPLPFDHPERIMEVQPTRRGETSGPTAPEFVALRNANVFEHVTGTILGSGVTMMLADIPEIVGSGIVSADYFAVFGAKPQIGRTFTSAEDAPGGPKVVVLSHRLWVSRFNSDPGILGRPLQLDGVQHTVIGVMPASFDFMQETEELWVPLALTPEQATRYSDHFLRVFARLKPATSLARAQSAATSAERALAEHIPERPDPVSDYAMTLVPFADQLVGGFAGLLLILLGAVGFVLLISCTNVANLLLARGTARAKELAIRAALGAGRARLIRQLLAESLVLAVAGAVAGLAIAYGLLHVILAVSPEGVPRLEQARIDWRVLTFTLLLGLVSCVLFGLLPALRAAGPRLQGALREGGRQSGGARDRLRGVLVVAEVALAITLLVASGLLLRSAWLMQHVDPGFEPRGVLTARLLLPAVRYPDPAAITRTYATLRDQVAQIPGVKSASLVSVVPLSGSTAVTSVVAEGQPKDGKAPQANLRLASSGYFTTMGVRLIAGRDLARQDNASSRLVTVVNEALVEKLWPTLSIRQVLGKRVDALAGGRNASHLMEIVGVVANMHDDGLERPAKPEIFVPFEQTPEKLWPLLQRSLVIVAQLASPSGDPETLIKPLRRAVASVDPSLPLADSRTMTSLLRGSLETMRMNTLLLSLLGGIAFALATVGIYGVVSYFVTQRTHEIGVRIALGATPPLIWKFVVRRGFTPIFAGLVIGLLLSSATTSVLRGQLYGVGVHDPFTLVAVGVLLSVVGLLATYVPARRAMRVPPVVALNDG
jgi:putative ABC transport system permease protein